MSTDNVNTLLLQLKSGQFLSDLGHASNAMRNAGLEGEALSRTVRGVGQAMVTLVAGSTALKMLFGSVQAASAAREDLAQFNHVMRNVTKTADEMVQTLTSDAFGRTNRQAQQMLMGMTSLAKGMGMTDKSAVQLAGSFSKMSVDIGSFMMVQPEAVMNAFQSALMGNTMALRTYGVFLSEDIIKTRMAENAKKGLVFASQREARARAIESEALYQQADAIGDYAVEAENFGNQQRKFFGNLAELPALFGKGLVEPANEFYKIANKGIDYLKSLDASTWKFISTTTALGTALGIGFGAWRIGSEALRFYRGAQAMATAATAAQTVASTTQTAVTRGSTAAITAETAALTANTAARAANSAANSAGVATRAASRGTTGTATVVAASHLDNLRTAHSRANNEIAVGNAAWDAASRRYNQTGDIRYLGLADRSMDRIRAATRQRNNAEMGMEAFYGRGISATHGLSPATATYIRQNRIAAQRRLLDQRRIRRNLYTAPSRGLHSVGRGVRSVGRGIGRSAVGRSVRSAGRGISAVAGATIGRLPGASLVMGVVRQIGGVIMRFAPMFFGRLGAIALTAINPIGWAVGIVGSLALVGNYLPTLMFKAYDAIMGAFSKENMDKIWEWFKESAMSALNWTIQGMGGALNMANSAAYGIVNTVTNLVTAGHGTHLQTAYYAAYKEQQRLDALLAEREEIARREKQITEFRTQVSEQERKWIDQEMETLKKRSELAGGRFDSIAKENQLVSQLQGSSTLTASIGYAKSRTQVQLDQAALEVEKALKSGDEDAQAAAREKYNVVQARMDELRKQEASNAVSTAEAKYALFDTRIENAGKQKSYHSQMTNYESLMNDLKSEPFLKKQEEITKNFLEAQRALNEKRQDLNYAIAAGEDTRVEQLRDEVSKTENRLTEYQNSYNEIQANLSDQRKLQEKMDEVRKKQEERHDEATKSLWSFNFEHAGKGTQQQMARQGFFKAQNQFEGAYTDEEREKALQDMQNMYGRIDKQALEMPVWNGFLNTTAGAVESESVAAQELQERILNDFNKVLVDEAVKQSVMQAAMKTALEQMVENTDPNQQARIGGSIS